MVRGAWLPRERLTGMLDRRELRSAKGKGSDDMTEATKPKTETLPPEWWDETECGEWTEWHTGGHRMHPHEREREMGIPPDEEAVIGHSDGRGLGEAADRTTSRRNPSAGKL